MLRSTTFSKGAAYAGMLGNAIGFGLYVPTIGIYISLLSVVGLWIWYILIGRRLFQLGQGIALANGAGVPTSGPTSGV